MKENVTLNLVSIIIPTYNREDFIIEALESVLAQSYTNFEIIIVDDGSTDATSELLKKYVSQNVKYFQLKHAGNISRLRNFGLQQATGEFIAYLDADDRWSKEKLQEQVNLLNTSSEKGLVFTDVVEFSGQKIVKNGIYQDGVTREISFRNILNNSLPVYPSSILYRRSGLKKMDLHDESFLWNDLGFITRYIALYGAVMIPHKLTHIRKHDQNISTVKRNEAVGFRDMILTTEILYKQKLLTQSEFKSMSAQFYERMGTMLAQLREYQNAKKAYAKAFTFKPWAIKTIARYCILTIKCLLPNEK